MKKILSYLIATAMLIALIPSTAFATSCNHVWSEWESYDEYTCTEGTAYRYCEKCYEEEEKTVPATTDHVWSEWETYEGYLCEEQIAFRECEACYEYEEKTLPPAADHNCIEWDIWDEATCVDTGTKASYCEDCGELQEVEIPATGIHKWSDWWLKEGTTCLTGGTSYRWCETCDKEETKPFAPIGKHTWSGWKVWDEATIGHAGNLINYCTVCSEANYKAIKKIKTVKLSATKFTYNGKSKKPTVTVKDTAGKKLVKGTDYTIKYKNSKGKVITKPTKTGKYKVAVTFKGKYRGTVTRTFTINPKGTSLKTVKAGDDKITVKWNKNTKQVTGYQIRYSTSSKFTKGTTKYTLAKGCNTTSKTIKNLKDSKKYYVQIRTYKTDNGTKVYSGWSKTKTVKTR